MGTALDAATGVANSAAAYENTADLIGVFKTVATAAGATLPSQVSTCKGASTYQCISVGSTADQCPAGSKYEAPAAAPAAPISDSGAATIVQNTAALMAIMAIALQLL